MSDGEAGGVSPAGSAPPADSGAAGVVSGSGGSICAYDGGENDAVSFSTSDFPPPVGGVNLSALLVNVPVTRWGGFAPHRRSTSTRAA